MDRLQRIYKLHQAFSSRRHPVSCQTLQDDLECSRATVNRIIQEMRLYFNAPAEVEVSSPKPLRKTVMQHLRTALARYR